MPTLDWIGKNAVVGHHRTVPYHLLKCDKELSVGDPGSGNLLVQGDNLLALKALLPYYAGKVKCIYIDPPYNTGNENWIYNDNVNSPQIRKWLGQVVGKEAEDLTRHDKWLCMMYPRLALLREFLSEDGAIFVSINDDEEALLRLAMDELYGRANGLGSLVWKSRSSSAMRGMPLSIDHEYVLIYAKQVAQVTLSGLSKGSDGYPFEDARGKYASTDLTVGMTSRERPNQFFPIANPRTGKVFAPNPERVWRFFPDTMAKVIEQDLIIWPDEAEGNMTRPRFKTYWNTDSEKPLPVTSWVESSTTNQPRETEAEGDDSNDIGRGQIVSALTQEGGRILASILGTKAFAYPKPVSLIQSIIRASTDSTSLILDSFAGSGTTGHAVLQMNKADSGNRRFICIEMDETIARDVTSQRLRKIVEGYTNAKGEAVEPLGGGFRFCSLGKSLFDEWGNIDGEVKFADLAAHVYFTETGEPIPKRAGKTPLLGIHNGRAIYLLFNGVLGDKRPGSGNVLTHAIAKELPAHDGLRVVYGEACRLSAVSLKQYGITFRQVPFELKVD